jgi:phage protein D
MPFQLAMLAAGAPADDLASGATRVEVCERIHEPTTYRIRYQLTEQDGDFAILSDGRLAPGGELTIGTQVADTPHVLVQGQVYGQKLKFMHGVRESWVEVCGGDKAFEMDREVKTKVWSDQSASDTVSAILSGYGVTPAVDPIATTHTEDTHTLLQRDTDLRFVRRLARRYGHWFWFTTDAMGTTTAHFKRPVTTGSQVATLEISTKNPSLAELEIEWDVERPGAAVTKQLKLSDLSIIDGQVAKSPLPPLGTAGLADLAPVRQARLGAAVDDVGDLRARAEATLIDGGWFLRARGQTNARALNAVLRTHTLVAVDGLGKRHSGGYMVASVRHVLDGDGHTMEFELIRNAWEA